MEVVSGSGRKRRVPATYSAFTEEPSSYHPTMLYFAYGSNMDPKQMRRRCPSSRFVATACLPDFRLDFTRRSPRRRCGVADVVPDVGAEVWGILYHLHKATDIQRLDRAEGYRPSLKRGNRYIRTSAEVYLDGHLDQPRKAQIYLAQPMKHVPPPSISYLNHMISGAAHWGLPAAYVDQLEALPSSGRL